MPGGCAQWPAFWTADPNNWPGGGEVDIVEACGHDPRCSPSYSRKYYFRAYISNLTILLLCIRPKDVQCLHSERSKGEKSDHSVYAARLSPFPSSPGDNNCDVGANEDAGCQTSFTDGTFGEALNGGGGGYFVMARSASRGIAMYFWNRYDPNVPPEIKYGADNVTPNGSWGEPQALFPTNNCDFNARFAPHNIIMNLSFCVSTGSLFSSLTYCNDESHIGTLGIPALQLLGMWFGKVRRL